MFCHHLRRTKALSAPPADILYYNLFGKIPVSVQIQSFMGADSEFHGCEKLISVTCL